MSQFNKSWKPGAAPVAVVLISLNEAHNLDKVLTNLSGWAQEVFLVDSCSSDETVDIALRYGVHVVQRKFTGFGDQWNFALKTLPITAEWTMKLDPDEQITDQLKQEIISATSNNTIDAYKIRIQLYFMGKRLPSYLQLTRLWRTGTVVFSSVKANEHAMCQGVESNLTSEILHADSPDLDHWLTKQNKYTTSEAISQYEQQPLSTIPRLFGTTLERRMWVKKNFWNIPGRFPLLFLYHLIVLGAWRCGRVGWIWSHLRTEVYRLWEYKLYEIKLNKRYPMRLSSQVGEPDKRVRFFD